MQDNLGVKENKMGTKPINKLLITMALPMMASMVIQAIYNIVDSIYVAKISQEAFNAVSLSFPIQNLMIALGSGMGVGVNALLSKSLGEKNFEQANKYAMNGIFLSLCSYIVMLIFGLTCSKVFFESQTDIKDIVDGGTTYLTICCCFSFGVYGQLIMEKLMMSTGKTLYSMFTQGFGAIINIILDPILIFGYFGIRPMGVAGAAWATVIGQIGAMILGIILNMKCNKEITLSIKGFKPSGKVVWDIYKIGIPSIIMQSIGSVTTYLINKLLITLENTATAAAVFGAYYKLQSFIFMPVFGLTNGLIPIVSYNLGAGNKKRMLAAYKLSILYAVVLMTVGMLVMMIIPDALLSFFGASEDMLSFGRIALRAISISFPFAGFCIMTSAFFQACGNGIISMIMSFARQIVVLIPVAYILGYAFGVNGVWYSYPIAEVMSCIIAVAGLVMINRKLLKRVPDGASVKGIKENMA